MPPASTADAEPFPRFFAADFRAMGFFGGVLDAGAALAFANLGSPNGWNCDGGGPDGAPTL